MISHTTVGIRDYVRAFSFYSALMNTLGYPLKFENSAHRWAAWSPVDAPRPLFIICPPFDQQAPGAGNGQMVALLAEDRRRVDRAYATALAHGARSEGAPGLRPHYHADYYGAYFRDPDGNKLCVCCHLSESVSGAVEPLQPTSAG